MKNDTVVTTKKSVTKKTNSRKSKVTEKAKEQGSEFITPQAHKWLNSWVWDGPKKRTDATEPKAYPPLWYVGPALLQKFSEALGHPLTLEEVQYMIRRDGDEEVICWATGQSFIPITYPSDYIPEEVLQALQGGSGIEAANIYKRGQFNIVEGEPRPLSGSIYHEIKDPRPGEAAFDYAYSSPLVILAVSIMRKRHKNYPVWTCVSKESLETRKEKSRASKETRNKIWGMIQEMDNEFRTRRERRQGKLSSVRDAFQKPAKGKRGDRQED